MLAVLSAKNDFNLQRVTTFTRAVDPEGNRTLGLITKPDTLDPGSASELSYLELAQNKDVTFRLGWHVLCNRSFHNMDTTDKERDKAENEFFNQGNILDDHIRNQFPEVQREINIQLNDCQEEFEKLGPSLRSPAEQRAYLIEASRQVTDIVEAAIEGNYQQHALLRGETGAPWRLRARIQNSLAMFAKTMGAHGQAQKIVDSVSEAESADVKIIERDGYLEEVRDVMLRHAITYNHYLTETFQAKQSERQKQRLIRALREFEGDVTVSEVLACMSDGDWDEFAEVTEPDMDTVACLSAMDWMEAYYKVALKQFVDNFSCLVIENCLVTKFKGLFTIKMINAMSDETLESVVGEKHEIAAQRAILEDKQRVLEAGLKELKNFLNDSGISN
ncbi:hypothetical protein ONZ43_g1994 [Nemania bipapillata]|uniref:Uncharacterized protein n=1 Tax=Nemania bipapillata TaxID=110536 RepID=A0ACC2J2D3_9PEZI|nr:hypothetical protein ONZ43_g1994 [Nemania bipapillata]